MQKNGHNVVDNLLDVGPEDLLPVCSLLDKTWLSWLSKKAPFALQHILIGDKLIIQLSLPVLYNICYIAVIALYVTSYKLSGI